MQIQIFNTPTSIIGTLQ